MKFGDGKKFADGQKFANGLSSSLIGWHFGTDRFEREGEFFRATIGSAEYR